MTFGNMSEVLLLLALPWFFKRLGIRNVLLIGFSAWALRFIMFALGAPDSVFWMIMIGVILHGACYDFVYIAGQIYLDKLANPSIRAQAQGIFVLTTYGLGQGVGTLISQKFYESTVIGGPGALMSNWQTFWFYAAIIAAIVVIVFMIGSKPTSKATTNIGSNHKQ